MAAEGLLLRNLVETRTVPAEVGVEVILPKPRHDLPQPVDQMVDLRPIGEPAGSTVVIWDGRDDMGLACAPGVYFVRLTGQGRGARRPIAPSSDSSCR